MLIKNVLLILISLLVSSNQAVAYNNMHVDKEYNHLPVLDPVYYNLSNFIKNISLVNCTLNNGRKTQCFELKVKSTPINDGPYCPETLDDIGGIYIYDGKTNPGLRLLDKIFFINMEIDGYDIVDENENIRKYFMRLDKQAPPPDQQYDYCIEAEKDINLQLTYKIPAYPEFANKVTPMASAIDIVGLSLHGLPVNGLPPSVVKGPNNIGGGSVPALDPCGGHILDGFYHSHIIPETINEKLLRNHIFEVECESIPQKYESQLTGYAMDGFPIYGRQEITGLPPQNLDKCNGHVGATFHYPFGIYHYHAVFNEDVDIPRCLSGELAKEQLVVE
ncbi:YHYH protein [Spartinivicinus poritis]|uniref:YHYH protein n=1 Tax=Spartinivicinus poritis TaxID=2994640 RepID=A0ABT5U6S2_9GAMM|nr:YHYH protein [Spartinivicinus sp. A2-2]MDE1462065.1 YHYH protein [Spartinivicinus sp. A2-2]